MYLCVCALAPGGLAPTVYKFLFMLGLGPPHLRRARLMRGQFEPQSNRHTAPPCCCIHHRTYPMHICNINLQPLTKTQSTNRPHIDKQCSPAFNSDGISWSTAGRRLAIVTRCIRNYFFLHTYMRAGNKNCSMSQQSTILNRQACATSEKPMRTSHIVHLAANYAICMWHKNCSHRNHKQR